MIFSENGIIDSCCLLGDEIAKREFNEIISGLTKVNNQEKDMVYHGRK